MQQGILKFTWMSIGIAIIGLIILLAVFFLLSPYQSSVSSGNEILQINMLSILSIYVGIFLFFMGMFTTIFFKFKTRVKKNKEMYILAISSLRQGFLIGLLICILLFLQSQRLLIWWDALLVVGAIVLIEMYLAVNK